MVPPFAAALTHIVQPDTKHLSEVRIIKISAPAEISFSTRIKKAGVLRNWMSSIFLTQRWNSLTLTRNHVNSTSHFCAHFSGYIYNYKDYHTKIHDFYLKLYAFQNKILPPSGICSNRVEVILTMWN